MGGFCPIVSSSFMFSPYLKESLSRMISSRKPFALGMSASFVSCAFLLESAFSLEGSSFVGHAFSVESPFSIESFLSVRVSKFRDVIFSPNKCRNRFSRGLEARKLATMEGMDSIGEMICPIKCPKAITIPAENIPFSEK